jgi:hypothetical protein
VTVSDLDPRLDAEAACRAGTFSISNGMDLPGVRSSTRFIVTGAVLLLAASEDAVSCRGRQAADPA